MNEVRIDEDKNHPEKNVRKILAKGDIISIGNNVAEGSQHYFATIFKIDFHWDAKLSHKDVVDLSSPAGSPRPAHRAIASTTKPVISTARVDWVPLTLSPSPTAFDPPARVSTAAPANSHRSPSYSMPDADSEDYLDDYPSDVEEIVEQGKSSADEPNLQPSIPRDTVQTSQETAIAIFEPPSELLEAETEADAGIDHEDTTWGVQPTSPDLAAMASEDEDIESDFESSEHSASDLSERSDYESDSPPSSPMGSTSPIIKQVATSNTKPVPASHDQPRHTQDPLDLDPYPSGSRAYISPYDGHSVGGLTDCFAQAPPCIDPFKPSTSSGQRSIPAPGTHYLPPLVAPPPYPSFSQPQSFEHQHAEPHPYYPVHGVSQGPQPRSPWWTPSNVANGWPSSTAGSSRQETFPGFRFHPQPTATKEQRTADAAVKYTASPLDRISISSMLSPSDENAKASQAKKRNAADMEESFGNKQQDTTATDGPETTGQTMTEPATKKRRVEQTSGVKAKTLGTFALGALAGGVALLGALVTLPEHIFA